MLWQAVISSNQASFITATVITECLCSMSTKSMGYLDAELMQDSAQCKEQTQ